MKRTIFSVGRELDDLCKPELISFSSTSQHGSSEVPDPLPTGPFESSRPGDHETGLGRAREGPRSEHLSKIRHWTPSKRDPRRTSNRVVRNATQRRADEVDEVFRLDEAKSSFLKSSRRALQVTPNRARRAMRPVQHRRDDKPAATSKDRRSSRRGRSRKKKDTITAAAGARGRHSRGGGVPFGDRIVRPSPPAAPVSRVPLAPPLPPTDCAARPPDSGGGGGASPGGRVCRPRSRTRTSLAERARRACPVGEVSNERKGTPRVSGWGDDAPLPGESFSPGAERPRSRAQPGLAGRRASSPS
ncbi:hypothetical protein THAOC_33652, partial [Thalassiosira oceanica]